MNSKVKFENDDFSTILTRVIPFLYFQFVEFLVSCELSQIEARCGM